MLCRGGEGACAIARSRPLDGPGMRRSRTLLPRTSSESRQVRCSVEHSLHATGTRTGRSSHASSGFEVSVRDVGALVGSFGGAYDRRDDLTDARGIGAKVFCGFLAEHTSGHTESEPVLGFQRLFPGD